MNAQTEYCSITDNEQVVRKTYLVIGYNIYEKIPNYVGYALTRDIVSGDAARESSFHQEASLKKMYRQTNADYYKSGYDKGHMSPAADWKSSQQAMYESFALSNVCPQNPTLNRRYWAQLEEIERYYAYQCDTLYVVTGVILNQIGRHVGSGVRVPDRFYKACVGVHQGEVIFSDAWIYLNSSDKQLPDQCETTIDDVEYEANVDLFAGMWFNEKDENLIVK